METAQNNSLSMPGNVFSVAFIGGGYHSAVGRTHMAAMQLDKRFRLVAGCFSRQFESNLESANYYGVECSRVYPSLQKMLEGEAGKLDAIIVLTPTDQHKNDVEACLKAGVPVICEKALAISVEEALSIQSLLRKSRGFLVVTYNYSGYPMIRELRSMVARGQLGRVRQIQCEMPQESFIATDAEGFPRIPQDWRLWDGVIPKVSLDLGMHLHSIVYFLTGQRPIKLVAQSSRLGNFPQIVDTVSCLIRYSDDIDCSFWFSKAALGQRNGLKVRLYGDLGSAEWLQEAPEFLIYTDSRGNRQILDRASSGIKEANLQRYARFKAGHPAGFIEAFANYYQDISDALAAHMHGKKYCSSNVFGIIEACEGIALFEAAAISSREQRWVDL
jgi:predicted dehydrogenase